MRYRGKNRKISKNCHDNMYNIATKQHSALQINRLLASAMQQTRPNTRLTRKKAQ
ncbi:hypothetical protein CGSMWGv00703C2mash_06151 [Gardnerella pickettii 00703C2mash]|nr:hypothetical protein CGSMWGv00703C2mash_06151 [Gardnerella pickettii 00703C2mash]